MATPQLQVYQHYIAVAVRAASPAPDQIPPEACMPNLLADEIITQKHVRLFVQKNGPLPTNPYQFAGKQGQYMKLEGLTIPQIGGVDPIFMHDPDQIGKFRLVGRSITSPDLPEATIVFTERHGAIPQALMGFDCGLNIYVVSGRCKSLSDFERGWEDYVEILSGALATEVDGGDRTAWGDSDDQIEDSVSLTLAAAYPVGKLSFSLSADTQISREVVDVVYGSQIQCGACGVRDDGTKLQYAVTKSSGAGSPGLPTEVIYSLDGGATWDQSTIDNFGATEDPLAIDIVGQSLIVIGSGAYYYAALSTITGAPGTWTKVSTGFVTNKAPNDLYVAGPSEVYFAGDGGYLYKATDITAGVAVISDGVITTNDLLRIHGAEDTIVAVGAGSTVVKSVNRGETFYATTDTPSDIPLDIQAVAVLDEYRYWVGTGNSGRLYYTLNGGESWTMKAFPGAGTGNVYDIVFPTQEVGYFTYSNGTPTASLFSTWNGGFTFTSQDPRILNWPVFNRANRLAFPRVSNLGIASNNLLVAGLGGGGTDGILLEGVSNIV